MGKGFTVACDMGVTCPDTQRQRAPSSGRPDRGGEGEGKITANPLNVPVLSLVHAERRREALPTTPYLSSMYLLCVCISSLDNMVK